jgi:hypothetical protein
MEKSDYTNWQFAIIMKRPVSSAVNGSSESMFMYSKTFLETGEIVTLMTCINAAVNVRNKTGNARIT